MKHKKGSRNYLMGYIISSILLFFFYCLTKLELTDNLFMTILSTSYIATLQTTAGQIYFCQLEIDVAALKAECFIAVNGCFLQPFRQLIEA
jgi:hypothetical protein